MPAFAVAVAGFRPLCLRGSGGDAFRMFVIKILIAAERSSAEGKISLRLRRHRRLLRLRRYHHHYLPPPRRHHQPHHYHNSSRHDFDRFGAHMRINIYVDARF